jgi:hypothetical protein
MLSKAVGIVLKVAVLTKRPAIIKEVSKIAHAITSTGWACACQLDCALQISNYAKPGHRSRHNQVYWHCKSYYAFGLGAASYAQGRRFTRPRVMREYEEWVQGFVASGAGCPAANLPPESKVCTCVCVCAIQTCSPRRLAARSVCCSLRLQPQQARAIDHITIKGLQTGSL